MSAAERIKTSVDLANVEMRAFVDESGLEGCMTLVSDEAAFDVGRVDGPDYRAGTVSQK